MPDAQLNTDSLTEITHHQSAVLCYFSGPDCAVCKTLLPKVQQLVKEKYPKIVFQEINCESQRELCGQFQVFAIPTIIIFFDGRESTRLSRNFSLAELEAAIARPYSLIFE